MLGRLFKQNNSSNQSHNIHSSYSINSNQQHHHHQHQQFSNNTFEDSYSREILYGTHNINQLKPYIFNNKLFRIIISQDGGNLRNKQILFDTTNEINNNNSHHHQPSIQLTGKNTIILKAYHTQSELNDYMFGCGLPSVENQSSIKLHCLPQLTNSIYGSYNAVMITKLFSINDLDTLENTKFDDGNDWKPIPGLIKKEIYKIDSNDTVASRFSIGLIIPLESINCINDVIINNWQEILYFLNHLQKIIYKKILTTLDHSNCITNKRIQLPMNIFHQDHDLNLQFLKFIKLIHYNYNLPKLINSNYLMKNSDFKDNHNPMLISWVLEILNWLEFKDGKSTNCEYTFIASLIALILPFKKSLSVKPYYNLNSNTREVTRIVVMTGNPVVAKKLIFILNGFIPQEDDIKISEELDLSAKPIPIKKDNIQSYSASTSFSSDNSLATPSSKGWEIPNKSSTSVTTETPRIQTSTMNIPINNSLSKSQSSMAYLSSSLNSSYSSTQSNYSLSKFGSFMDKWKGQFQQTPNSTSMSNYFDEVSPNISKRNSVHSLRTPSPAIEFEEYTWQLPNKPINIVSPINSSPKLSRAQSMYDLYNLNVMNEEEFNEMTTSPKSINQDFSKIQNRKNILEIKRSKTSVYSPLINDKSIKNVSEHNLKSIKEKCKLIIDSKSKLSILGSTIKVEPTNFDNLVFKHRPLNSSIAYTDEIRGEFGVQSCPINIKLEQQILNTMKNDLSFYQKNFNYDDVTIRTIFISLKAREIKLLEMNTASSIFNDNTYKMKSKKVFTQNRNTGNKEMIEKVEDILNDINQLFINQQELYHDKKQFNSNGKEFYNNLTKLVYKLLG
ncbi:unnamed protein product [Candida verbasci]|uniref:Protein LST4 n=1 Tax=Candida verbasci TaxID=1227364 RepID=A0A9W4XC26_9ASCO|nr:unnamed protein product [Candida verbasci]